MKIAEYESECFLCEDKIRIGDNIVFDGSRKTWEHFHCPWKDDVGYRPDMVVLDLEDTIDIKTHIKNQKEDRPHPAQTNGQESGGEGSALRDSWYERLWKIIQNLFCD